MALCSQESRVQGQSTAGTMDLLLALLKSSVNAVLWQAGEYAFGWSSTRTYIRVVDAVRCYVELCFCVIDQLCKGVVSSQPDAVINNMERRYCLSQVGVEAVKLLSLLGET